MSERKGNTGVHFSSHTNSTYFTDCCNVAVCSHQDSCPSCGRTVVPKTDMERHVMCMRKMYGPDYRTQR